MKRCFGEEIPDPDEEHEMFLLKKVFTAKKRKFYTVKKNHKYTVNMCVPENQAFNPKRHAKLKREIKSILSGFEQNWYRTNCVEVKDLDFWPSEIIRRKYKALAGFGPCRTEKCFRKPCEVPVQDIKSRAQALLLELKKIGIREFWHRLEEEL